MRKLLVALPLVLLCASCQNFTWQGRGSGVSEDQQERGIKDPAALAREYETEAFWRGVRARRDGRVNSFGMGLARIQDTFDRHIFNYSPTDPFTNYATDQSVLSHSAQFGVTMFAR